MGIEHKNDVISQVNEELLNYLHKDIEFSRDYLSEQDIDIENERAFFDQSLKKMRTFALGKERQQRDSTLFEKVNVNEKLSQLKSMIETLSGQALQNLLIKSGVGLQFRNLEKWTDEEMREALNDIDLIKLLDEFDDDK
jgi:hypothetical protein